MVFVTILIQALIESLSTRDGRIQDTPGILAGSNWTNTSKINTRAEIPGINTHTANACHVHVGVCTTYASAHLAEYMFLQGHVYYIDNRSTLLLSYDPFINVGTCYPAKILKPWVRLGS